ncbi:hypothetical protein DH2020_049149 [Rehmannia glutinosa]|uniref:AP2/ERF domain-containing protein n=1 Tax=Rehmannia glutinosa TaxID=99300 RepID=A0ABR0U451_REHGL
MESFNTWHSDEEVILASTRPKKPAGRKKFKETRHPIYRGVRRRNSDKWVCELREPTKQKRIWLGTYMPVLEGRHNKLMAARAHDVAALALRGQAACLNFADSVWRLPIPASNDPLDIRKAAVEAAETFRPTAGEDGGIGGINENVRGNEGSSKNVSSEFDVFQVDGDLCVADGALMSPPPRWFEGSYCWDDVESDAEVELIKLGRAAQPLKYRTVPSPQEE